MQGTTTELLLVLVLITLSAFFSATETAYSSLNRARLKSLADRGQKRAADTLALADRYDELLSTILVGNNIVNIALASVGAVMFVRWLGGRGRIHGRCDRVCADLRRNLAQEPGQGGAGALCHGGVSAHPGVCDGAQAG